MVAVEPRLFGEALVRALTAVEGLDVTLHLDERALEVSGGEYDIALVSGSLRADWGARAIVRLPDEPGAGSGTVEIGADRRTFHFAGLIDVTDLIAELARG